MHRYVAAPIKILLCFNYIYLDILGLLTTPHGYTYLLTCVDRFAKWPEAIPISTVMAKTVARPFVERWITLYGCPFTTTTKRGQQFESELFTSQTRMLFMERISIAAYNPSPNGLQKRSHWQLKSALWAHENPSWYETLPLVFLGIRTGYKADVHSTTTNLEGEFCLTAWLRMRHPSHLRVARAFYMSVYAIRSLLTNAVIKGNNTINAYHEISVSIFVTVFLSLWCYARMLTFTTPPFLRFPFPEKVRANIDGYMNFRVSKHDRNQLTQFLVLTKSPRSLVSGLFCLPWSLSSIVYMHFGLCPEGRSTAGWCTW